MWRKLLYWTTGYYKDSGLWYVVVLDKYDQIGQYFTRTPMDLIWPYGPIEFKDTLGKTVLISRNSYWSAERIEDVKR